MLFNSVEFLLFFPIVTLLYFVLPHKVRYLWLLAASYYFYMCWNPTYALLMLTSTAITYASGLVLQKAAEKGTKKWCVAVSFTLNLAILFFFKYFYFTLDNINVVLGWLQVAPLAPKFDVVLPVGISFYTFQALSYTVDVYRGELKAEKNFLKYALFVSFFPQLVAGPIERSKNLVAQFSERHCFDYERAKSGLLLMLWGFFQKLVIADRLAIAVNEVYNRLGDHSGAAAVLATVCFAFQIYCDFASYSDIARGAAQVMGFRLMRNFRQPYFSYSIATFWRNWHISLSTWFRDYLYIPLGGNRKGSVRKYINLFIVFLTSGLWHGASWNFVIWGAAHGIYQVVGGITKKTRDRLWRALHISPDGKVRKAVGIGTTFVLVTLAWVFFRADSLSAAKAVFSKMFLSFAPLAGEGFGLDAPEWWVAGLALLVLFAVSLCNRRGISVRQKILQQKLPIRWSVYLLGVFVVLIFGIYGPGFSESQFIYFQF